MVQLHSYRQRLLKTTEALIPGPVENRTHIRQIFVQDTYDSPNREPLSLGSWYSYAQKKRSAERENVFERLSRPRTTPAEVVRNRTSQRAAVALSDSQRAFHRATISESRGQRSVGKCKQEDRSTTGGTATVERQTSVTQACTSVPHSKLVGRCCSAPVYPTKRPSSSYHYRCVDNAHFHSKGFVRPVYIGSAEEASHMIRSRIKGNKEMLVAILDCSSIVPELFQRNLLRQEEVTKILSLQTKQDQNRRVLSILVSRQPHIANKMMEVICGRQIIFKDLLLVPGLKDYIARFEEKEYGKKVCRALKCLKKDANAVTKSCPICYTNKRKRRSHSANVTQVGRDFSNMTLSGNKMPRPAPIPLSRQEKRKLLENLETISEVSTTFGDEENAAWIRVLRAEPEIVDFIYRHT